MDASPTIKKGRKPKVITPDEIYRRRLHENEMQMKRYYRNQAKRQEQARAAYHKKKVNDDPICSVSTDETTKELIVLTEE